MTAHLETFLAHARGLTADAPERAVRESTRLASLAWAALLAEPKRDDARRFASELDRLPAIAGRFPDLADRLRWYRVLVQLLESHGPDAVGRALRIGRQALADQQPIAEIVHAVTADTSA